MQEKRAHIGVQVGQEVVGDHAELPGSGGGFGAGQGDEGALGQFGRQPDPCSGCSEGLAHLQVGRAGQGVDHHHIHLQRGVAILVRGCELTAATHLYAREYVNKLCKTHCGCVTVCSRPGGCFVVAA